MEFRDVGEVRQNKQQEKNDKRNALHQSSKREKQAKKRNENEIRVEVRKIIDEHSVYTKQEGIETIVFFFLRMKLKRVPCACLRYTRT